jgi:hypothetical protein
MNLFRRYFVAGLTTLIVVAAVTHFGPPLPASLIGPLVLLMLFGVTVVPMLPIISTIEYTKSGTVFGHQLWGRDMVRTIAFSLPLAFTGALYGIYVFSYAENSGQRSMMVVALAGLTCLHILNFWNGVVRGRIEPLIFAK